MAITVLSCSYITTETIMKQAVAIDGDTIQHTELTATRATIVRHDNLPGEICMCYAQAVLLAAERNKKVDDTLKSLIEHGINNLVSE